MQLYSIQFVVFLIALLALYYLAGRIRPQRQWLVLLVGSLVFYAASGWLNFVFIFAIAFSGWACGIAFKKISDAAARKRSVATSREEKKAAKTWASRRKWLVLLACLVVDFGILAYLKYWNAILGFFGQADGPMASSLLLPLGISFFTFQSVGYVIDSYNSKVEPERNFLKYLLFISWFPQLLQGPINRFDPLGEKLFASRRFDVDLAKRSLLLLGFGLMKKYAIANMLVRPVAASLNNIGASTPGSVVVFGILLYSAQQYTDFSGGIDMVLGISGLFGIEMAKNFRQPYFSTSLADFWRRWHITLGAWMRDYVFYPFALRPSMQRFGKWAKTHLGRHWGRTLPASIANILVFFLVGIWHGAETHFVLWGLYNGLVIAAADLASPIFSRLNEALGVSDESFGWRLWRIIRTFVVVNIGWYFDRIERFDMCMTGFRNTLLSFDAGRFLQYIKGNFHVQHFTVCLLIAMAGCLVVFIVSVLKERGVDVSRELLAKNVVVRYAVYTVVMMLMLLAFSLIPSAEGFMYANF